MQRSVERHPAKMFAYPAVEIQARPALIGLPQPQKHFNLNCCSLGWGGRRGGEAVIEMCVLWRDPEAGVSQLWGRRWEYATACYGDEVRGSYI